MTAGLINHTTKLDMDWNTLTDRVSVTIAI